MKGAQCTLNLLMLSLPPCLTLLEPQCQVSHVAATSAPPLPSETVWAEEGGGGEVSSWPIVYKKRFTLAKCIPRLLPFLYTSSHCAVLPLVRGRSSARKAAAACPHLHIRCQDVSLPGSPSAREAAASFLQATAVGMQILSISIYSLSLSLSHRTWYNLGQLNLQICHLLPIELQEMYERDYCWSKPQMTDEYKTEICWAIQKTSFSPKNRMQ